MLVNMFINDVGREQGGGIPLLKTIFQERVNLPSRPTMLNIVVRDYVGQPPVDIIEEELEMTLKKAWNEVHTHDGEKKFHFDDFLSVTVTLLPHKLLDGVGFSEKVKDLKGWFLMKDFDGRRQNDVPASGFCSNASNLWRNIKDNKRLDLPELRVLVSNYECKKIKVELLEELSNDQSFTESGRTPEEFNEHLQDVLSTTLSKYDITVGVFYDSNVTAAVREDLMEEIYTVLGDTCREILQKLGSKISKESGDTFTIELNKQENPLSYVGTQIQFEMKRFDEETQGLNIKFKNAVADVRKVLESNLTSIAERIAQNIEDDRCQDFLKSLCSTIEKESKDTIIHKLQQEQNPTNIVEKLVDSCMTIFDGSSEDLNSSYSGLRDDCRNTLQRSLFEFTKSWAQNIEAQRKAGKAEEEAEEAKKRQHEAEHRNKKLQQDLEDSIRKAEEAKAEAQRKNEEARDAALAREKAERDADLAREKAKHAERDAEAEEDKRQALILKLLADQAELTKKQAEETAEVCRRLAELAEQNSRLAHENARIHHQRSLCTIQ